MCRGTQGVLWRILKIGAQYLWMRPLWRESPALPFTQRLWSKSDGSNVPINWHLSMKGGQIHFLAFVSHQVHILFFWSNVLGFRRNLSNKIHWSQCVPVITNLNSQNLDYINFRVALLCIVFWYSLNKRTISIIVHVAYLPMFIFSILFGLINNWDRVLNFCY